MTAIALPERLDSAGIRRAALSGCCASLVGLGLARFAYTPLIPALISAHWLSQSEAAYLGAANLAGYLAGALLGRRMIRWIDAPSTLRLMMALTSASLLACAWKDAGSAWFFAWRLIPGFTGGSIMVLAAPTVLACVPHARRGIVGGVIFTGVGLGIAASGTLVPRLIDLGGVTGAWLGLGGVSLVLTLVSWNGWPRPIGLGGHAHGARKPLSAPLLALLVGYGLNAVGLVPHMVFLVVYIARGLGRGLETGAVYWVLYGFGATMGPLLAGQIGDRIGFQRALRIALLLQAAMIALPVAFDGPVWLAASSIVIGAFTPGIVPLALGRVHELVEGHAAQARAWSFATASFALAQALGAYGCSYLLDLSGNYALLFSLAAAAVASALLLDVGFAAVAPSRRDGRRATAA